MNINFFLLHTKWETIVAQMSFFWPLSLDQSFFHLRKLYKLRDLFQRERERGKEKSIMKIIVATMFAKTYYTLIGQNIRFVELETKKSSWI